LSSFGAYEDDMEPVFSCSEQEVERILAGREPAEESLAEIAAFVREARDLYLEPPADPVATVHLAALLGAVPADGFASDSNTARDTRRSTMRMRFRRNVARTVVFAAILAALTASLAAAGVDLPVLPESASDEADEALVNAAARQEEGSQAQPEEVPGPSAAIRAYVESVPPSERGCEFGQTVATIASGSDPTPDHDPCAEDGAGDGEGATAGGGEPRGGQATGDAASGGVSADARAGEVSGGPEVGEQASGGTAGQAAQDGQATGAAAAEQGQATGAAAAQAGQGNRP
jgi:hypothetical protein